MIVSTSPSIDLQRGWPTTRLFPAKELSEATQAVLNDSDTATQALVYGPGAGYYPLRASLASWLSDFYTPSSGQIPVERVGISGGASQNLASILQVFSDPARTTVWMVEPVYFHACTIFHDAGFANRLRGVPEGDQGIEIEFFRRALMREEDEGSDAIYKPRDQYQKIFRHILYVTPTFSNPSGKTMSLQTRRELVSLAREFDVLIISDDVYDFLRWPTNDNASGQELPKPPQRIVDVDRETCPPGSWGNCVSNASFSKIVAPGVRVGWYEATVKFVSRLAVNGPSSSGGNPAHMTSTFIHHLLSTNALHRHVDTVLVPTYRTRSQAMFRAIHSYLIPLGVTINSGTAYTELQTHEVLPAGGFFTYITFPDDLPTADIIAARAMEVGVKIGAGQIFIVKGDPDSLRRSLGPGGFCRGARLCWAWEEADMIEEGIRRLARVVRTFLNESRLN